MAMRAFPPIPGEEPITQQRTVILARSKIKTHADFIPRQAQFADFSVRCVPLSGCDLPGDTWLYEVDSTQVAEGMVLTEEHFRKEIRSRKRPVLIQWDYSLVGNAAGQGLPSSQHWLIITGYNSGTHKVRVFDPWPMDGVTETHPDRREYWISYDAYIDPQVDLGEPVFAVHKFDEYKLRRAGEPEPAQAQPGSSEGYPPLAPEPVRQQISLTLEPIDRALDMTRSQIDGLVKNRIVLSSKGNRLRGQFEAAAPIPIVILTTRQLMSARERPEALIEPKTSSLLVPVVNKRTGEVVDSFLLYNDAGTWKSGGYSNNQIAHLLVQLREKHSDATRAAKDFYMVSIPEQASFFAAHGFGAASVLVSLDNGGRGPLVRTHEGLDVVVRRIEAVASQGGRPERPLPVRPNTQN
jgi:hypothetical protein